MQEALDVLEKYWNHTEFRPLQYEIIASVLKNQDTLAIMPTGGGKSICFQVPAMMNDGICLVISPLIALMKDQVLNLEKKNIKAIALTGGISSNEIINLLDNCQFGNYKFLYLSPERLQSDWVLDRIKNLPINLIVIDEAHCISQWGHDFRPAYLKISELKKHFPKTAFLALTATATKRVKDDILNQLEFKNPVLFEKSFARENIAYMVFKVEDKLFRLQQILTKNPNPSIIYVRNRKSCIDISQQLNSLGFSTTFYHGGMSAKEKEKNMQGWLSEKFPVIVATNAFGMGIDKPNVKTVIHIQLPENIENYYQESGRAGRNGEKAFSIILTNASDIIHVKNQFLANLPDSTFLKAVYIKLCNHLQIAYGEGFNEQYAFNLHQFCIKYNFPTLKTFNAVQFLDRQGILDLTYEFSEKIKLQFLIPSSELIRYTSFNPKEEEIILSIVRAYPGIYELQTAINLELIAKKSNHPAEEIIAELQKLKEKNIVDFQLKNNDSVLTFNEIREDEITINRVAKHLTSQNELKRSQLEQVIEFVNNTAVCKNKILLNYFGEQMDKDCGICSICLEKNKKKYPQKLNVEILKLLETEEMNSREIEVRMQKKSKEVIDTLQELLNEDQIEIKANNKYSLKI